METSDPQSLPCDRNSADKPAFHSPIPAVCSWMIFQFFSSNTPVSPISDVLRIKKLYHAFAESSETDFRIEIFGVALGGLSSD